MCCCHEKGPTLCPFWTHVLLFLFCFKDLSFPFFFFCSVSAKIFCLLWILEPRDLLYSYIPPGRLFASCFWVIEPPKSYLDYESGPVMKIDVLYDIVMHI